MLMLIVAWNSNLRALSVLQSFSDAPTTIAATATREVSASAAEKETWTAAFKQREGGGRERDNSCAGSVQKVPGDRIFPTRI